jgi:tetratricopeptide (TPR) repeat protein
LVRERHPSTHAFQSNVEYDKTKMPSLQVCFRNEKGGIKLGGTDMTRDNEFNDLYANGMYAFVNENYENSIALFIQAAEIKPDNKLVFVSKGAAHLKLDRAEEALIDINRAIEIDENYAKAYHIRGLINEKIGNDDEALSDFTHAIDLDPEYGAAYNSRATLHAKMGNEDLATEDIMVIQSLTNIILETFANENNVWRSQQLRVEQMMETELER